MKSKTCLVSPTCVQPPFLFDQRLLHRFAGKCHGVSRLVFVGTQYHPQLHATQGWKCIRFLSEVSQASIRSNHDDKAVATHALCFGLSRISASHSSRCQPCQHSLSRTQISASRFWLVNHQNLAASVCGSLLYMAPEAFYRTHAQSPKMDVWSLFVTIADILHAGGFDGRVCNTYEDILGSVRAAAATLPGLSPMARETPKMRTSAAQMLVEFFNGEGLSTARSQIAPISEPEDAPKAPQASKRYLRRKRSGVAKRKPREPKPFALHRRLVLMSRGDFDTVVHS